MKHLVLGSSGQVGSHLVKYLKSIGESVIPFDIQRDVVDEDLRRFSNAKLWNLIQECDFVHFLAFDVGGSKYLKIYQGSVDFIKNNFQIMDRTFEALAHYEKPFIFSSSQMSNMTNSAYGALKLVGEKYTEALGGLTIKFWNVYGKEADDTKAHVITDFINMAKKGKIEMMTDGVEQRQFLHADDASACMFILAQNYGCLDKKKDYHVTSFEWSSIYEIALELQKLSGCEIIKGTNKDTVQAGFLNQPDKHILNYWMPKISLQQGIRNLYE